MHRTFARIVAIIVALPISLMANLIDPNLKKSLAITDSTGRLNPDCQCQPKQKVNTLLDAKILANEINDSLCEQRQKYFEGKLKNKKTIPDGIASLVAGNPTIYFVGEDHINGHPNPKIIDLFEEMRKQDNDINCLFLEADPRFQPYLDDYLSSTDHTYSNTIQAANKNPVHKSTNKLLFATKDIMRFARDNEIWVYAMDAREKGWDESSFNMAAEISDRFKPTQCDQEPGCKKEKKCNKAIVLVGSLHLTENPIVDKPRQNKNIPSILEKQQLSSVKIELSAGEASAANPWYWPNCTWNPSLNQEEYAFAPGKESFPQYPPESLNTIVFEKRQPTDWNQLDLVISLPLLEEE